MCEFYVSFKTYCLCLHFIYDVDEFYCLCLHFIYEMLNFIIYQVCTLFMKLYFGIRICNYYFIYISNTENSFICMCEK